VLFLTPDRRHHRAIMFAVAVIHRQTDRIICTGGGIDGRRCRRGKTGIGVVVARFRFGFHDQLLGSIPRAPPWDKLLLGVCPINPWGPARVPRDVFASSCGLPFSPSDSKGASLFVGLRPARDSSGRGRGGIGRRAWFRSKYRKMWGFESLRPHQFPGAWGTESY